MRGSRTDRQTGERMVGIGWFWHAVTGRLPIRPAARLLRQLAGMPDYIGHVEHLQRCHPERPVPSEREFFDEYLRARYADGPTRCC